MYTVLSWQSSAHTNLFILRLYPPSPLSPPSNLSPPSPIFLCSFPSISLPSPSLLLPLLPSPSSSQAVNFLHECGVLLHYDDLQSKLSELYFLDPEWLCTLMAHIITVPEINSFISPEGVSGRGNAVGVNGRGDVVCVDVGREGIV